MVKFTLKKIEYDWLGKISRIEAVVEYENWKKNGGETVRVWRFFCEKVERFDINTKKSRRKRYFGIQAKKEEIAYETKHQKTREERRLVCKCKEKCKAEFGSNCSV